MNRAALALPLLCGLAGCGFAPTSPTQRLADSAYDLNTAMRFGRTDVAMEEVSIKSRDQFVREHSGWGKTLRIVDLDFAGLGLKEKGTGVVDITVTWQRPDEAVVRVTQIEQQWELTRTTWHLVSEAQKSGDPGLLVDPAKAPQKSASASPAGLTARPSYQTRVIYEQ